MRIALIWKNDYPWDVRVEKIARTLAGCGHDICVLSANAQGRARNEKVDGLSVRRLPATAFRPLNALISLPFYLNPFWFRFAARVMREERIDLVIVRDLPLILIGVWLKRRFRVRLLLDMAEDYPAMYREYIDAGGWRAWLYRLIKNPALMALVERRTLPLVDHVFVVVEESARRLRERLGLPAARVSVVSNTPRLEQFAAAAAPATPGRQLPLRLVYAGLVQEARGLEDVIEAIALLRARGTRMRFKVIGSGPYLASLARLVEDRSLQDLVELTGWVAHADLARHVRAADAGVIPHPRNAHTDTTVPNKLFDYMACGLPVVVSNAAPLERIVTAESCGFVFSAGDPQSLVAVLERVAASRAVLATLGQNGARAVKSRYHWERDAAFLVDAVARFASAAPGAQPRLEGH